MTIRKLALCADDYGYRAGVSAAIAQLIDRGRLSATCALVTFAQFRDAARDIPALAAKADIGLHVDLVEGVPLGGITGLSDGTGFPGLKAIITKAVTGKLDGLAIAGEIRRQIEAFRDATGRDPDFIDGHQHTHALPVIRHALLGAMQAAKLVCPVRDPSDTALAIMGRGVAVPKTLVIHALTRGIGPAARAAGLRCNDSFSGAYDLQPGHDLAALFPRFFTHMSAAHLVMCHPGSMESGTQDPIAAARAAEYAYLASDRFAADLAASGVELARFTALAR